MSTNSSSNTPRPRATRRTHRRAMTPCPVILHVEPNECIQRLVRAVLGPLVHVNTVETVSDAQAYLQHARPDLVITADLALVPEGAKDVVVLAASAGVPVAVLTGAQRRYRFPPHVRVMRKPASVEELRALVEHLAPVTRASVSHARQSDDCAASSRSAG